MRLLLAGLLLAACCVPTSVYAQHEVTLQLQVSQPGSLASVEQFVRGAPPRVLLRCESFCSAQLQRGRYQLRLESADRAASASTSIRLIEPSLFISRRAQPVAVLGGILMIGAGAVVAFSGIGSLLYSVMSQMCHGYQCAAPAGYFWYGVTATPIGLLLALGGWLITSNALRLFDWKPALSVQR